MGLGVLGGCGTPPRGPEGIVRELLAQATVADVAPLLVDIGAVGLLEKQRVPLPMARPTTTLGAAVPTRDGKGLWIVPVFDSTLGPPGSTVMVRVRIDPTGARVDVARTLADPSGAVLRLSLIDEADSAVAHRLTRIRHALIQYPQRFSALPGALEDLLRVMPTLDLAPERFEWRVKVRPPGSDGVPRWTVWGRARRVGAMREAGAWYRLEGDGGVYRLAGEEGVP